MERSHVLGMAAGYYLSRLDSKAYQQLALGNKGETHRAIGQALGVPYESVRNWRDEFDPIHNNCRKGWHKRDMRASRVKAAEVLSRLDDGELGDIICGIVADPTGPAADRMIALLGTVD